MTTIVVLFNLKPGVAPADYEAWARSTDLPTVKRLGSIADFRVLRATGLLGSDAPAPYAYVEIIEVADMAGLGTDIATPAMQQVTAAFATFADQPAFILTAPI